MARERPEDRAPKPGSERETGPTEVATQERFREGTRTLAARLPPAALPSARVSPDFVRELAAELAAHLLAPGTPVPEVQEFMMPYQCTGVAFKCDGYYKCTTTHSCSGTYTCPTAVSCPKAFSGLSISIA
jgi:hypothetical protein